jgi:hypothetical protein
VRLPSAIVLAAAAIGSAALLLTAFPVRSPFADPDSVEYLLAAKSLAAGENLRIPPWDWKNFRAADRPLHDFPPGFPAVVALASRLGTSPERAIVAIPAAAYVLLPIALWFALRRSLPRGEALAAAILSSWLVAVAYHGTLAMSDVPFLLLTAVGFGLVFEAVASGRARLALAGGVVAGVAMSFRNVGLAAPAAVAGGLGAAALLRILPARSVARLLGAYAAGALLAYSPVVVRNVVTFGAPVPWERIPATVTGAAVAREVFSGLDRLFLATNTIPWTGWAVAFVLAIALSIGRLVAGRRRGRAEPGPIALVTGGTLLLYAALVVGMVVATRRSYEVDSIGDRYRLQVHWILGAWLLVLVRDLAGLAGRRAGPWVRGALFGAALLLVARGQLRRLPELRNEAAWNETALAAFEPHRALITGLPADTVVTATTLAPQLRVRFGRPVLQLWGVGPVELADFAGRERDLVVLLHPTDDFDLGAWRGAFAGEVPRGYRELADEGAVRVLALDRPDRPARP